MLWIGLCLLVVCALAGQFEFKRQIVLPQNTMGGDFSQDQKYLFTYSPQYVQIYSGVTGNMVHHITNPALTVSHASFSQDNSKMAIGYTNGKVYLLFEEDNFNVNEGVVIQFEDDTQPIKQMCFTADNRYLIIMNTAKHSKIMLAELAAPQNSTIFEISSQVSFLLCSSTRSNEFAVGVNKQFSEIIVYNFDPNTDEINERAKLEFNTSVSVQAGTYSNDGSKVIFTTNNHEIYKYNIHSNSTNSLELPQNVTQTIVKIAVSKNQKIIGLASDQYVYSLIVNSDINETMDDMDDMDVSDPTDVQDSIAVKKYESSAKFVALTPSGGNLFFIDTDQMGIMMSQCQKSTFYNDERDTCDICSKPCSQCEESPSKCYSCQNDYYLSDNVCKSCMDNCGLCLNDLSCVRCHNSFVYRDKKCLCANGTYLESGQCKTCPKGCTVCTVQECKWCEKGYQIDKDICQEVGGLAEWVIVLILMVGIAILCSLFVCSVRIRGNKKNAKQEKQKLLQEI